MSKRSIPNILRNLWVVTVAISVLVLSLFALIVWPHEAPLEETLDAAEPAIIAKNSLDRGFHRHREGRLVLANMRYDEAIEAMPGLKRPHFLRGSVKMTEGKLEEALADFTAAIDASDTYHQAYNSRGFVKFELGDAQGAVEDFTRAIELWPDFAMAVVNRGLAKKGMGDFEGAMTDLNASLEMVASSWGYDCRGSLKFAMGDVEGAFSDFKLANDGAMTELYSNCFRNSAAVRTARGDTAGAAADLASYQEVERLRREKKIGLWRNPPEGIEQVN